MALVLNAEAACPILGRHSARAHHLHTHALLGVTLKQPSLELASLQKCCRDNKQRLQLLRCSCHLSILAFRLARAVNRRECSRRFELMAMARVRKRCLISFAWQLLHWQPSARRA